MAATYRGRKGIAGTEMNSMLGIRIRRSAGSHLVELVCKGGMAVFEAALKPAVGDSTGEPEAGSPKECTSTGRGHAEGPRACAKGREAG